MSSEVLEMYETLTDESRKEVNNFIQRLVAQQAKFEQAAKDDWEEIFATADRMKLPFQHKCFKNFTFSPHSKRAFTMFSVSKLPAQ